MKNISITETFTLPSHGKIYNIEGMSPTVELRSMTTLDEMKRLSYSESEYKTMADIIDDCIISEMPISAYDMCLGDYQFLLHKLRIVTYGPEYRMSIQCPNCGEVVKSKVDLDTLEVLEYDEETFGDRKIKLPVSKKEITLRIQTPRMLDNIKAKAKERKRKSEDDSINYEFLFTIMALIEKIDNEEVNEIKLEKIVKDMNMKDIYYIIQKSDEMNRKVGLDTKVIAQCTECGYEVVTTFRIQPEFFRPFID